jgi:hypothetical protein
VTSPLATGRADRDLLRFETSNKDLYDRSILPSEVSDRFEILAAQKIGYEVGSASWWDTGQSYDDRNDILLFWNTILT